MTYRVKGCQAASMVGLTLSARATEHEASRETTSKGLKLPALAKRFKMVVTLSEGRGMRPSTAGAVALGRPARNSSRGAPYMVVSGRSVTMPCRS